MAFVIVTNRPSYNSCCIQQKCIDLVEDYIESISEVQLTTAIFTLVMRNMRVYYSTISFWHRHYLSWVELQCATNATFKNLQQKWGKEPKNKRQPRHHLDAIKTIASENPELYLEKLWNISSSRQGHYIAGQQFQVPFRMTSTWNFLLAKKFHCSAI